MLEVLTAAPSSVEVADVVDVVDSSCAMSKCSCNASGLLNGAIHMGQRNPYTDEHHHGNILKCVYVYTYIHNIKQNSLLVRLY